MLCRHLSFALLVVFLASPAWAIDLNGGFKASKFGSAAALQTKPVSEAKISSAATRVGPKAAGGPVILSQSKFEQQAGKIGQLPLKSRAGSLDAKVFNLPCDLAVDISATRNTYSIPSYAHTDGHIVNRGPGSFSGERIFRVYAVNANGSKRLLMTGNVPALRPGQSHRFFYRWPNANEFAQCTFQVILHGSDLNDSNNSAACNWEWESVVP